MENSPKKEINPEQNQQQADKKDTTNQAELQAQEKEKEKEDDMEEEEDISDHESLFDEKSTEQKDNNEIKNSEEKNQLKNINVIENIFMGKKHKKELTEEQKAERIKRNIERYCKRNDEMLELLEKINNSEATNKNINRMMRLLAIDLSDTKKLTNKKALISQRKKDIFNKLLNLTFTEYQYFWYTLTDGKYKKGHAQLIKSSNIQKARMIYQQIIEERNKEEKKLNEKTVGELINDKNIRENENDKLDDVFLKYDSDISSDEDSMDSSLDESSSNEQEQNSVINKINKESEIKLKMLKEKELKEKEEKERKEKEEKEEKEKKEKEEKEKQEVIKKIMNKEDEIDIFN